ncbi:MAG: phenylalanine--tRNA ligase subunit alpha [bacterium]
MEEQFRQLENQAKLAFQSINSPEALEDWRIRFLGRKGQLAKLMNQIKDQPLAQRPSLGRLANSVKKSLEKLSNSQSSTSKQKKASDFENSLPGLKPLVGQLHPLTKITRRIVEIFRSMGYESLSGPEVELTKYNFDLLNIPADHPARDLWDTFYVQGVQDKEQMVLRTHTSPVQIRAMETRKPPVRLIAPGRVFRHEATDASHESTLTQCEGLVIAESVRLTDLFGTVNDFLSALFEREIVTRHRPSYFPFVEPGGEIIMRCTICQGQGCSVCGRTGWLEMGGQGMVHPNVLKNMKIDPNKFSGFAFGFGIDRLLMLLYQVPDIRLILSGDVRFTKQF